MDAQVEVLEERLNSFLTQLKSECVIFDRLVYKNKNQHRRCSYFQYLLKVRRDLRLLQSVHLEDVLSSCYLVITERKPKQKVHFLESLKKKKCDGGKANFLERLLGAARLLSQMVEPMLKAATEISTLLARSFFMGFSLTVLSLIARLRVLVQQILLDIVPVFNSVSSISQKPHSIKIVQDGIEVFREYYPTNKEVVILECLWDTDKFVLHERIQGSEIKDRDVILEGDVPLGSSSVQYQSMEAFLGDDEPSSDKSEADDTIKEGPRPIQFKEDMTEAVVAGSSSDNEEKQAEGCMDIGDDDGSGHSSSPTKNFSPESCLPAAIPNSPMTSNSSKLEYGSMRKVAFVSVNRPVPPTENVTDSHANESEIKSDNKEDPIFSLLNGGNMKESLF